MSGVSTDVDSSALQVQNVGQLISLLRRHPHSGFPIVSNDPDLPPKTFVGFILRSHLCILLKHPEIFLTPEDTSGAEPEPDLGDIS